MPTPRSGRTSEHELLDLLIERAGVAKDLQTYVVACRRANDSWRLMAGELTAKLDRPVTHVFLHGTFREHPEVLAAEQAYADEQAARLLPAKTAGEAS